MTSRALSPLLILAFAAAAAAEPRPAWAASGAAFVLDGGDLEAASLAVGSCPAPHLEDVPPPPTLTDLSAAVPAPARPIAFEYSDGYYKRLKVHKVASFATLPLFVTQAILGQKLYGGEYSDTTRDAHTAVAIGTATLFGVNTVTGVMNLWEGRKDPARGTRTRVHGILMLAADAGFVATGLLAPGDDGGGNRSAHRAVALASMGVATAAYLIMLLGG